MNASPPSFCDSIADIASSSWLALAVKTHMLQSIGDRTLDLLFSQLRLTPTCAFFMFLVRNEHDCFDSTNLVFVQILISVVSIGLQRVRAHLACTLQMHNQPHPRLPSTDVPMTHDSALPANVCFLHLQYSVFGGESVPDMPPLSQDFLIGPVSNIGAPFKSRQK